MPPAPAPPGDDPRLLSEDDVRRVVRLLSDALSPDDGRNAQSARLMDGLADLADADGWLFFRTRFDPDGGPGANIDFLYGGAFDQSSLGEYADYSLQATDAPTGEIDEVKRLALTGQHFTRTRGEMIPDAVWRSGTYDGHIRRMGLDAFVYSTVPLTERHGAPIASTALLFRRPGRPEFDPRVCRLIHLVVSECGPLHRRGLDLGLADHVADLTPRQRTVLALLIDGMSVKRAAAHLGLSPHTVGDHVKAIYRYFDVQTRAELMRRFIHGNARRGLSA